MRTYPHCDARVLHAPGDCKICDDYASDLQEIRQVWNINFTGEHDGTKSMCPAELARSYKTIERWGGNRRWPKDDDGSYEPFFGGKLAELLDLLGFKRR